MKSFGELSKEQITRENDLLSHLIGELEVKELANLETELSEQRNVTLFKITTEIEATEDALNQVEQLSQRLKKHLKQLTGLQQALSK